MPQHSHLLAKSPAGQGRRRPPTGFQPALAGCQDSRMAPYMEPAETSTAGLGRLLCSIRDSLAWNWKSSESRSCTL